MGGGGGRRGKMRYPLRNITLIRVPGKVVTISSYAVPANLHTNYSFFILYTHDTRRKQKHSL